MQPQPVKELRDTIAISAMKVLIKQHLKPLEYRTKICKQAYIIADEMLKARKLK